MVNFNSNNHTYTTENGTVLISVTQLLRKHSITPDYSAVNPVILQAKAERGTMIHKEIEDFIKEGKVGFTEEFDFFQSRIYPQFNDLESEVILYNDKLAGTADLICKDNHDNIWIIDYKTGQVHKDAVRWQLSLYKYLLLSMRPEQKDKTFHLAVFDAKELCSRFYELDEIPTSQVENLLKCEFENDEVYTTELVGVDNLLNKALVFEQAITSLENQKKQMESEYTSIKEQLKEAMINGGVSKYESDKLLITLKGSYERTSVDSKRLQEKFPEVYEACKKTSTVAESLLIKVKESV